MKLFMYGAGSIGRGFIGCIFARAGYEVVFADIDERIVNGINSQGGYPVTVAAEPPYEIMVRGVRAVSGYDREAIVSEIAACDIMATSLGASALEDVAPIIARGFARRCEAGAEPLNILICENLKDSSHLLREWIKTALPEELHGALSSHLGLVETAIGRMVPAASKGEFPSVNVEEYDFLPVNRAAFRGPLPRVPQLIPYAPFAYYEERKLYLHNMGHAVCAYLGLTAGHTYIWQAVEDPTIRLIMQSAMTESASMLSVIHDQPFQTLYGHAEDLLLRFANRALNDTCERVGRDPLRKLQAGDRFAGALSRCWVSGVHPVYIAIGYGAALRHMTEDASTAAKILKEAGGLTEEQASLVMRMFDALHLPASELLRTAERVKKELRGKIV